MRLTKFLSVLLVFIFVFAAAAAVMRLDAAVKVVRPAGIQRAVRAPQDVGVVHDGVCLKAEWGVSPTDRL